MADRPPHQGEVRLRLDTPGYSTSLTLPNDAESEARFVDWLKFHVRYIARMGEVEAGHTEAVAEFVEMKP